MSLHDTTHFNCTIEGGIARISLNRPERKNPLTFDSYAELRDWFRALPYSDEVHAVVIVPNGGNFSSGGDVHDIIGPLTKMNMKELLAFTRMTGDLVKAMLNCTKPVIAAVDGICAGAGAIMAMASDLRIAALSVEEARIKKNISSYPDHESFFSLQQVYHVKQFILRHKHDHIFSY